MAMYKVLDGTNRPPGPGRGGQDDTLANRLERWEGPAIEVLPYLMLSVSSVLNVVIYGWVPQAQITLGVAAVAGAWILGGFTLHPSWRTRQPWMSVFFTVLVVLMAVLVLRSPIYGFFSFTGYFFAFWLPLGRWRLVGVIAVALITATSQNGGLPKGGGAAIAVYGGLILINVLVAGAFTWFGWASSEQNDRRKVIVAELSESNRKLESTLEENAGLHEQLMTQAREAGVLDERQRMAREIHDTLAQSLAGIITQLQAADQVGRDDERRRHLSSALQLARDGLSEARRSVYALRPEPLQASRIEEALDVVAERWSALHDIPVRVATTGRSIPLPADAELTMLRTAQEALANVAKHARAHRVGMTLSFMGDQVTLDVRDDGIGFTCPSAGDAGISLVPAATASGVPGASGGFGLTAMRERVEGLNGTLTIESELGVGTTISATLPLPCDQAAAELADPEPADPEPADPGSAAGLAGAPAVDATAGRA